jgi:outer membrane autotransporter protein
MKGVDTLSNNATYVVNGDALPRLSTNLNVGVVAKFDNNTTVEFDYTASFRSSYQEHGGMIKFKYHF